MSDNDFDSDDFDDDSIVWSSTSSWNDAPTLSNPLPDPNLVKSYYTAYRGLSSGSESRQALPPELVLYICRLAEFDCWYTKRAPEGRVTAHATGSRVRSHLWFQTEPFTKRMLTRPKSAQLTTISRHQGWVGDRNAGSWSWFELRVMRPREYARGITIAELKRVRDAEPSWRCLAHPVDAETAQLQGNYAEHEGDIFDSDHELWSRIEEGDVLQVTLNARFGGWSNNALDGILRIRTWWEPSPEMLSLMERSNRN